jgi:hypothetical protein
MVGDEHAARDQSAVPLAILVGQRMRIQQRIPRILVDDVLEVVDQMAIARPHRPARRVENSTAMADGVVVVRRLLVGSGIQEHQLVPLADDRPLGRAARGTCRHLEPFVRMGNPYLPGYSSPDRGDIGRLDRSRDPAAKLALRPDVHGFGEPPELQVVLQQPLMDLLAQGGDLGAQHLNLVIVALRGLLCRLLHRTYRALQRVKLRGQAIRHGKERPHRPKKTTNAHAAF